MPLCFAAGLFSEAEGLLAEMEGEGISRNEATADALNDPEEYHKRLVHARETRMAQLALKGSINFDIVLTRSQKDVLGIGGALYRA